MLKKLIKKYLTVLTTLSLIIPSFAINLINFDRVYAANSNVFINEFISNPDSNTNYGCGLGRECVELYNAGTAPQLIEGWYITDLDGNIRGTFGTGSTIPATGYISVDMGTSTLNNEDDGLILYDNLSQTIDTVRYGAIPTHMMPAPSQGKSASRIHDGDASWAVHTNPTLGATNGNIDIADLPTAVKVAATSNNPVNFINNTTKANVFVDVTLTTGSQATDTVTAVISTPTKPASGTYYSTANKAALDGTGTVTVDGLNANYSAFQEGTIKVGAYVTRSGIATEYFEGTDATKDTLAPAKPTATQVKAGTNNAANIINSANKTSVAVDVTLSQGNTTDTITAELSDGTNTKTATSAGRSGAGTVTIAGIDTTNPLNDGTITLRSKVADQAGNNSDWLTGTNATKDTVAPTSQSNLAAYYNAAAWPGQVTGIASDATSGVNTVQAKIQRNSDSKYWDGTTWQTAATWLNTTYSSGSWNYTLALANLTDGETYTIQSKATDLAANEQSAFVSTTFRYDNTAPTGSIQINNNETATTSTTVTLNLLASTDVTKMMISNNADFSPDSLNANSGLWIDIANTLSGWKLSAADGSKTVYAKFKDPAGNISAVFSDAITLDTTGPTGSISINRGANYTNNRQVTLTLSATDSTTVKYMAFSDNGVDFSTWENYATEKTYMLPTGEASKTVYVKFKDELGNVGLIYSDSIILDTSKPVDPTVSQSPDQKTLFKSDSITLSGTAEAKSQITIKIYSQAVYTEYIYADEQGKWSHTISSAVIEKLAAGEHTITVTVTDRAGNASEEKQVAKFTLQEPAAAKEVQLALDQTTTVTETATQPQPSSKIEQPKEETEVVTMGPAAEAVKGEETGTTNTTRTLVTLAILIIAVGAIAGGYYGYQWWMEKEGDKKKKKAKKQQERTEKFGRWQAH